VGVSENIVEASWQALVDSMEYYYNNYVLESGEPGQ
jgi:2-isopropylmalate synthase